MTTSQLLQELLELHPSAVQGMFIQERYGFACGYLVANGLTLNIENYKLARDWAEHWEDNEIPEAILNAWSQATNAEITKSI